jgi:hypothetical protein
MNDVLVLINYRLHKQTMNEHKIATGRQGDDFAQLVISSYDALPETCNAPTFNALYMPKGDDTGNPLLDLLCHLGKKSRRG